MNNLTMRQLLKAMDEGHLSLEMAASELIEAEADWEWKAKAIYDLIQFENGVDVGVDYPIEEGV